MGICLNSFYENTTLIVCETYLSIAEGRDKVHSARNLFSDPFDRQIEPDPFKAPEQFSQARDIRRRQWRRQN